MRAEIPFFQHYIDGEWHAPGNHNYCELYDPISGNIIAIVANNCTTDTLKAVDAATRTLSIWNKESDSSRNSLIQELKVLAEQNQLTVNPHNLHFRTEKNDYSVSSKQQEGALILLRQTPQNKVKYSNSIVVYFPSPAQPITDILNVLFEQVTKGNTLVLAPGTSYPLPLLKLGEYCRQLRFPAGVINLLTGPATKIQADLEHLPSNCISISERASVPSYQQSSAKENQSHYHIKNKFIIV